MQAIFVSKVMSYICVTVYYRLKHQPMVAKARVQHMAYHIAQNQKQNHVFFLNMIEWSQEECFKVLFCLLDSIAFC